MSKVVKLPINSSNMTPQELCDFVKANAPDCLICVGLQDNDTELFFKASNRMLSDRALWILEQAIKHVMDPDT